MGETTGKERPILFSGDMVRALLAGTKSQTRRLLGQFDTLHAGWPGKKVEECGEPEVCAHVHTSDGHHVRSLACPYGQPGDRLWVRETFHVTAACDAVYRADYPANATSRGMENIPAEADVRWTPSIHMPRWASRLTLEVTEVRVQRLQEISEEDAKAEGVAPVVSEHWTAYDPETEGYPSFGVEPDAEMIASRRLENVRHHGPTTISTATDQFRLLWDSLNGSRPGASWADSPWVWAVSFRVVRP